MTHVVNFVMAVIGMWATYRMGYLDGRKAVWNALYRGEDLRNG